ALTEFLQRRVGSQHAVEYVLEAATVDHRLVGAGDLYLTFVDLDVAIAGACAADTIAKARATLAILHDAAQFPAGMLQPVDARLLPELGAAYLGNDRILLADGVDVHRQLVQFGQQFDLAVLEATGLLHHAALNTGNQPIESSGMLIAQNAGRHQRADGCLQLVLGLGTEVLQLRGLLQLVHSAQLTLYRNAGVRQVVDIRAQQFDGHIKGGGVIVLEGCLRQLQACFEGGLQQRLAAGVLRLLIFLLEVVEVAVVIEDQKLGLVFARTTQVGPQAGAPANHLPELDPALDRFGEDQVDHLRHVDAGVEHVDRD